jgi:DNA-binding MarR family transcriptional regulator
VNEHSKLIERETGLSGTQLWAMKVIAEAAAIKPSDLARRMYLHPATVVGLVDRLVRKGLVVRTRSERDRRIVELALTEQGVGLLTSAPHVPQKLLVKGLERLSTERIVTVAEGVAELVTILGAEKLPPQLILSSQVNLPKKGKTPKPSESKSAAHN